MLSSSLFGAPVLVRRLCGWKIMSNDVTSTRWQSYSHQQVWYLSRNMIMKMKLRVQSNSVPVTSFSLQRGVTQLNHYSNSSAPLQWCQKYHILILSINWLSRYPQAHVWYLTSCFVLDCFLIPKQTVLLLYPTMAILSMTAQTPRAGMALSFGRCEPLKSSSRRRLWSKGLRILWGEVKDEEGKQLLRIPPGRHTPSLSCGVPGIC